MGVRRVASNTFLIVRGFPMSENEMIAEERNWSIVPGGSRIQPLRRAMHTCSSFQFRRNHLASNKSTFSSLS